MSSGLDLEAAFAVLEPGERAAVQAFAGSLGLDRWSACTSLRRVVVAVAVQRLATDLHPGLTPLGRLREAAWALGAGHDGARLAEAIARALSRWQSEPDKISGEEKEGFAQANIGKIAPYGGKGQAAQVKATGGDQAAAETNPEDNDGFD